ncbi:MAG TPA: cytochrome P460 family protein [Kofleriaceae bacterium]|nr:cytochrome P460 family protein [Kofleriaceae bacterium]
MPTRQTLRIVGVLVTSLGVPAAAQAGGDASAGATKSQACEACHLATSGDIPELAGQRETYIVKQLKAFKAGDRKHPVMNAITGVLSDADMDNIAAFWNKHSPTDTTVPPGAAAAQKTKMAFPKDFPKGFVLYRSVVKPDGATVAKQYINNAGFAAIKAGKTQLPDGTVILVENYAAKLDASKKPIPSKDGFETEALKGYEGMEARASWDKGFPELLVNHDWNYAVFAPDKSVRAEVNQAICLSCHIPAANKDYVFTFEHIQDKAKGK